MLGEASLPAHMQPYACFCHPWHQTDEALRIIKSKMAEVLQIMRKGLAIGKTMSVKSTCMHYESNDIPDDDSMHVLQVYKDTSLGPIRLESPLKALEVFRKRNLACRRFLENSLARLQGAMRSCSPNEHEDLAENPARHRAHQDHRLLWRDDVLGHGLLLERGLEVCD